MAANIDDAVSAMPSFAALEGELRKVEESIAALSASDDFIEDLIACHAYRKALLATLANRPRKRWPSDDVDGLRARVAQEWPARPAALAPAG